VSHDDIRQVIKLLNETGAAYWLVGGAAIELLVGHAIRSHEDIDVFVVEHRLQHCIDHFTNADFAVVPGTLVDEGVFRTFGIYATIPWPSGLLEPHVLDVAGEGCRTLTAANHLRMKRVLATWFAGGQMRTKDLEDVRWLQPLV